MHRRFCLRFAAWTTLFTVLVQNALQVPLTDQQTESSREIEDSDDYRRKIGDSDVQEPVKRFIGSLARAGELPSTVSNKRQRTLSAEDEEETKYGANDAENVKRYLGSIARQGLVPGRKRQESSDEEREEDEGMDKRYVGSAFRASDGRFAGKGFSPSAFNYDKRFLGSLARAGELGEGIRAFGKKRHLGSVARTDGYRFRSKRSLTDSSTPFSNDYSEEMEDEDYEGGDDLLVPIKRHIASLARNGWLPHVRSLRHHSPQPQPQRPPMLPEEETPKRNYYYRPTTSLSSRSHLLSWLRLEEERLRREAEAEAKEELNNAQGKRTIAALARSGELPIRFRSSRSADRLPAPPFMRMASYRGGGGGASSLKAPHAFVSSHVDGWGRRKRNVFYQRDAPRERCSESDAGSCISEMKDGDEDKAKRNSSSLYRSSSHSASPDERDVGVEGIN